LVHCFTNEPPAKFDHSFAVEVPDGNGGETTELAVRDLTVYELLYKTDASLDYQQIIWRTTLSALIEICHQTSDIDLSIHKCNFPV
jgi:hypothetical protein